VSAPVPLVPFACPACGRRFVVIAGDAAPEAPRCGCGAELGEAPLPSGVYEIRRARRASERHPASRPAAEPDLGYGSSHGYGPAHGGPTSPGDAPAESTPEPAASEPDERKP
jgi:hypothetical protein